jgi:hypothetical protein
MAAAHVIQGAWIYFGKSYFFGHHTTLVQQGDSSVQPSKIIIGAMRFADRPSAITTIRHAIDCGFNYIDTSPCYCFQSEEENSERWVGEALSDPSYRSRVLLSAKCSPGNGGLGLGSFDIQKGFGVRTMNQLDRMFGQSLSRLGATRFDYYHLWTTHTMEQLDEAKKPGGWLDGVMHLRNRWDHLGITTHADSGTIMRFLDTGLFEAVTVPLNVINTTRIPIVDYCREHGIMVIAMNPLAGGFLAADPRLKELALRYLMALDGVRLLIGFTSPAEVDYAAMIERTAPQDGRTAAQLRAEVDQLIDAKEPRCTACGYCSPCPEGISVGACLSYFNLYKYMQMAQAKKAFLDKQWEDGLRLDRCKACGACQLKCPNQLPVTSIIAEAKQMLYGK